MSLVGLPGSKRSYFGPSPFISTPSSSNNNLDAANEAFFCIGRIETSDEGSHTIDTTGSSKIEWRTEAVTFANGATTVKVGIAAVLDTAGPPGRAANAADVITFDVSKSYTGGGGGITSSTAIASVPDTGTKTIAHGDLVAVCIQMTARGGADVIRPSYSSLSSRHRPVVNSFLGGVYAVGSTTPNVFITFSDGATGWISGGDVFSTINNRTWNSSSSPNEYGQLYQFPFPVKVYGVYSWVDPDADFEIVLYSAPLGTPVAERTIAFDANTMSSAAVLRIEDLFSSPYTVPPNTPFGMVFKPGASNISAYYKTLASAGHRAADEWGTSGYGISRASGAFADANSGLDHYYIGLVAGAFEHGVQPTYAVGV